MGISYSTSVLPVGSKKYGTVCPGERYPLCSYHTHRRLAPVRHQDYLLPSDGKFKLIILPGYLIHPQSREQLWTFATSIRHCIEVHSSGLAEDREGVSSRLSIYIVACDSKEDITWRQVPSDIAESWRWLVCHFSQGMTFDCTPSSCYTVRDCRLRGYSRKYLQAIWTCRVYAIACNSIRRRVGSARWLYLPDNRAGTSRCRAYCFVLV